MAGQSDVRAGSAYVEISAKDNTKGGLDGIGSRLKSFGKGLLVVAQGVGIAALAGVGALAAISKITADIGADLQKSAEEMGATVEEVGALQGFTAAQSRGAVEMAEAFEDVQGAGAKLAVSIGTAVLPVVKRLAGPIIDLAEAGASFVDVTTPLIANLAATATEAAGLGGIMDRLGETWRGVVDAITAGELGSAVKLTWLRVQAEWTRGTASIKAQWSDTLRSMAVDLGKWAQVTAYVLRRLGLGGAGADFVQNLPQLSLGQLGTKDQAADASAARVADLERQIAELSAGVKQRADDVRARRQGGIPQFPDPPVNDPGKAVSAAARGTFSSSTLRGQFGGESLQRKANDLLAQIKREIERGNDAMKAFTRTQPTKAFIG